MATVPSESVRFRTGAVPDQEMVVILEESATKINAKATGAPGGGVGLDLETVLSVQAWVRRPGGVQHSWIDLHVFDACDRLIRSETLALKHLSAAKDLLRQHEVAPDSALTHCGQPARSRRPTLVPAVGQ